MSGKLGVKWRRELKFTSATEKRLIPSSKVLYFAKRQISQRRKETPFIWKSNPPERLIGHETKRWGDFSHLQLFELVFYPLKPSIDRANSQSISSSPTPINLISKPLCFQVWGSIIASKSSEMASGFHQIEGCSQSKILHLQKRQENQLSQFNSSGWWAGLNQTWTSRALSWIQCKLGKQGQISAYSWVAFYTPCTVSADTGVETFCTFYTFCAFCADNRVQKSTQRIEARYGTHLFVQTSCVHLARGGGG